MDLGIIYGERIKWQLAKIVGDMLGKFGVEGTAQGDEAQKLSEAVGALIEEAAIAEKLAKIRKQGVDFTLQMYVTADTLDWQMYREEGAQAPASPYFYSWFA